MISSEEIRERWKAGETLDAIAGTFAGGKPRGKPVSRQAISKRLLRMGLSPREREYAERAAAGSQAAAERLDELSRRADERAAATARLQALADHYGLTPKMLLAKAPENAQAEIAAACAPFSAAYIVYVTPSG